VLREIDLGEVENAEALWSDFIFGHSKVDQPSISIRIRVDADFGLGLNLSFFE
jgi:hypothetical protein